MRMYLRHSVDDRLEPVGSSAARTNTAGNREMMSYWLMKSGTGRVLDRRPRPRAKRPRRGSACATTRLATTCATRCASATGVLYYHFPLRGSRHRRAGGGGQHAIPRCDAVRPEEPVLRPEVHARESALGGGRREACARPASCRSKSCARAPTSPTWWSCAAATTFSITPVTPREWKILAKLAAPDAR